MESVFMRFPEGKAKALTLSYDDGVEQDVRLIGIMQQHGLKGTFNISSGCYAAEGTIYPEGQIHRRMTKNQCINLYKDSGMEIAVHGLTHPFLEQMPVNLCTYDILMDRLNLENDFDTIVRGMAYPYGTTSDSVVASLKQCGIVYSRTTVSTERFDLPTDWLRLPATCHHNNPHLMALARRFAEGNPSQAPRLFYLWGHSFEFEANDNWNVMEEFAEYIGGRDDIWYATNIEIYDYTAAFHQLIFRMNGSMVHNPTALDLWFVTGRNLVCVKAGETLSL